MNTVARFETALQQRFLATGFSGKASLQVCFERDARAHSWRVVTRRLGAFSLHHRHPQVPQKLFFDRQKNIYVRCRPDLGSAPPEMQHDIACARRQCGKNGVKNTGASAMSYKKISAQDAALSWSRRRNCLRAAGTHSAPPALRRSDTAACSAAAHCMP